MKKQLTRVLTLVLAFAMLLSCQIPVFAADAAPVCPGKGKAHNISNCTSKELEKVEGKCGVGYTIYACTVCDTRFLSDFDYENAEHKFEVVLEKDIAATCGAPGTKAHKKCSECGALTIDGAKIVDEDALVISNEGISHTWGDKKLVLDGDKYYYVQECTKCDATSDPEDHDHVWEIDEDTIVEPDSVKDIPGSATVYCTNPDCPKVVENVVILSGHVCANNLELVDEVPASCTQTGMAAYYECACGKIYTDEGATVEVTDMDDLVLPMHGDNFVIATTPAGCTIVGVTAKICGLCNEAFDAQVIEPVGHTYAVIAAVQVNDKWLAKEDIDPIDPANKVEGTKYIDYEINHEATCGVAAYTEKLCVKDDCDAINKEQVTYDSDSFWKVVTWVGEVPTHVVETATTPANCQNVSLTFDYCTNEDCTLAEIAEVEVDEVTYSTLVDGKPVRVIVDTCDLGDEVDPDNHLLTKETARTDATCTKDGNVVGICEFHNVIVNEVLPATGHDFGDEITVPSTCVDGEGEIYQECETCGFTETLEVLAPVDTDKLEYEGKVAESDGEASTTVPAFNVTTGSVEGITATVTPGCFSYPNANSPSRYRLTGELEVTNSGVGVTSIVLELYSNATLIATSTLVNEEYLTVAALSWNFVVSGEESSSWETVWVEGNPRSNLVPTNVVLYINGVAIDTDIVNLYKSNDRVPGEEIVWAEFEGVATVVEGTIESDLFVAHPNIDPNSFTVIREGTCALAEARGYTCPDCNKTYVLYIALDHVKGEKIDEGYAADCTEDGKEPTYECANCGEEIGGATIPALEHDMTEWTEEVPAECGVAGKYSYSKCERTNCGYIEYVNADGEIVAAKNEQELVIKALEHDFEDLFTDEVPATCTETGLLSYAECANGCGVWAYYAAGADEYTEVDPEESGAVLVEDDYNTILVIAALGHAYDDVLASEADCNTLNYTLNYCDQCEAHFISDYAEADGHDFKNGVTVQAVDASCTTLGNVEFVICATCKKAVQYAVDKETKAVVEFETAIPDNATIADYPAEVVLDMLPHIDDEGNEFTNCETKGKTCVVCGNGEAFENDNHQGVITNNFPATCDEPAHTVTYCTDCDNYIGNPVITGPKLGHDRDEGVAKEDDKFVLVYTCKRVGCDYTEEKVLSDLAFTVDVDNAVLPDECYVDNGRVVVTVGLDSTKGVDIWGFNFQLKYNPEIFIFEEDLTTTTAKGWEQVDELGFNPFTVGSKAADGIINVLGYFPNNEQSQMVNYEIKGEQALIKFYFTINTDGEAVEYNEESANTVFSIVADNTEVTKVTGSAEEPFAVVESIVNAAHIDEIGKLFDVNHDGSVAITDFGMLRMIIAGSLEYEAAADVDNNGVVNILDLSKLAQLLVGEDLDVLLDRVPEEEVDGGSAA